MLFNCFSLNQELALTTMHNEDCNGHVLQLHLFESAFVFLNTCSLQIAIAMFANCENLNQDNYVKHKKCD